MTSATPPIEYSFTSRIGDQWVFSFDRNTNTALVKGDDVGWESYPVVEGVAYGLEMNKEEQAWLAGVWKEATNQSICTIGLYLGNPTEFVLGKSYCFLSDNYCPICLLQKKDFEVHHCIWSRDGGPDTPSNLLAICNSCHAVITRGSVEDRFPKNQAALYHQIMYFGVNLFQDATTGRNTYGAALFAKQHPPLVEPLESFAQATPEQRDVADRQLKAESRIRYQYYRDLGLGKWSWSDHERLFLSSVMEFEKYFART